MTGRQILSGLPCSPIQRMPHAAGKLWLKMFSTKSMHERNGRIDKGRFDPLPSFVHFSTISTMQSCLLTLDGSGKVFFAGKSSEWQGRWVAASWHLTDRDCDENRSIVKGRLDLMPSFDDRERIPKS
jgi:hypothetical protein